MQLEIGGRWIGPGAPCFVIAEAGVNHNGDLQLARRMVDAAADAGADAVKFQTFRAECLAAPGAPQAEYQRRATGRSQSQLEMLRQLELSARDHAALRDHCRRRGILFLSSPFDEPSADLLAELDVELFKLPSGELTNLEFIGYVARQGRPLIVSTGMASLGEVEAAVDVLAREAVAGYALLHCVSSYPAEPADVNLRAMHTLRTAFGCPVGFSDHTLGTEVALAAVALGACVLEKHFTLDRALPGPDHQASLEVPQLGQLVRGVRRVEAALGSGGKRPAAGERDTAAVARKSLVAAHDIPAGTRLTRTMLVLRRPGTGLPPAMGPYLLDRIARRHIPAGTLVQLEDVA